MNPSRFPRKDIVAAPHSKEAEMMVLGHALNKDWDNLKCLSPLTSAHFYFTEHKSVFDAIFDRILERGTQTVEYILEFRGKLKSIGGVSYLRTLEMYGDNNEYISEYVQLLVEMHLRRRIIESSIILQDLAMNDDDAGKILSIADNMFGSIRDEYIRS